jgi:hypothetical protein
MLRTCTAIAISIAAALAVAACGGSHKPKTSTQANAGQALSSSALHSDALRFAQCMRANGVPNFPDPSSSGGGIAISSSQSAGGGRTLTVNGVPVDAPAFQTAQQKCQKNLPQGPTVSTSQLDKLRAGALAMAKCMRAHGVTNFPDPVVSAGPGGHGVRVQIGGPGVSPTSPAFQAAQQTCGHLMGGAIGPKATAASLGAVKAAAGVGRVEPAGGGGA